MACACRGRKKSKFKWSDGTGNVVVYNTEIESKAKVLRKGGSYVEIPASEAEALIQKNE